MGTDTMSTETISMETISRELTPAVHQPLESSTTASPGWHLVPEHARGTSSGFSFHLKRLILSGMGSGTCASRLLVEPQIFPLVETHRHALPGQGLDTPGPMHQMVEMGQVPVERQQEGTKGVAGCLLDVQSWESSAPSTCHWQ